MGERQVREIDHAGQFAPKDLAGQAERHERQAKALGQRLGMPAFVEVRKALDRDVERRQIARVFGRDRGHQAGIETAAQQGADRHVAHQPQFDRLVQNASMSSITSSRRAA